MFDSLGRFINSASGQKVEAVQLTKENVEEVVAWCDGFGVETKDPFDESDVQVGINVPTRSGRERLSQGEWLIKGRAGNFFICGPEAFAHNFERS